MQRPASASPAAPTRARHAAAQAKAPVVAFSSVPPVAVCLPVNAFEQTREDGLLAGNLLRRGFFFAACGGGIGKQLVAGIEHGFGHLGGDEMHHLTHDAEAGGDALGLAPDGIANQVTRLTRSEEHTSELQSLMRISYTVFCL